MKAQELRIGNLVEFKGQIETAYQIKNSGIDFLRGTTQKGIIYQSYVWEAINPIPLKGEWFLKFGFNEHAIGYYNKNQNIVIGYANTGMYEYRLREFGTIIKYVHQLQNLYFALTGEELTLKEQL